MSTTEQTRTGRLQPAGPGPARRGGSWRLAVAVVLAVAAVVGLRTFVAEPQRVASASMSPTLCTGDLVVVQHLGRGTPEVGDIVTFRSPQDGSESVKRVVATAGQEVRLADGVLVVDGTPVDEPFVNQATIDAVYFGPATVAPDSVFVMGDEREFSIDSRVFGSVPLDAVDGRIAARLTHADCPVR